MVMMYKWDAEKALELLEQERISVFHGVPTMTWEIMQSEKFNETDLRSLRGVQSGGAPRPPEHLKMMLDKFPEKAIPGLGYGLTETNAIGAIISGAFYEAKPHSTGRPTPPVSTVMIADEAGNELAPNAVGEICIKGPTVMKGYWNKPEETAKVMTQDGFFKTGDIGIASEDGYHTIVDRKKDMVISGGINVYPREVEEVLFKHPNVSDAAVIGIPDEKWGEAIKAYIVTTTSSEGDAEEIRSFCEKEISKIKVPKIIEFIKEIPRNAGGKVLKTELRKNHDE